MISIERYEGSSNKHFNSFQHPVAYAEELRDSDRNILIRQNCMLRVHIEFLKLYANRS